LLPSLSIDININIINKNRKKKKKKEEKDNNNKDTYIVLFNCPRDLFFPYKAFRVLMLKIIIVQYHFVVAVNNCFRFHGVSIY